MKNVISLLMAALVASVLASGCGEKKHKECSDAGDKKAECDKGKFEENKFVCTWLPDAKEDNKGVCEKTSDVEGKVKAVCIDAANKPATIDDTNCKKIIAKQKAAAGSKDCVANAAKDACEFK